MLLLLLLLPLLQVPFWERAMGGCTVEAARQQARQQAHQQLLLTLSWFARETTCTHSRRCTRPLA